MVDQGRALTDLRERAEIHALRGELDLAHADLDAIRELRGFVPNAIHDAEDLRVVAAVRAAAGDLAAAERALREVIERAERHRQPQLQDKATRDLAVLLGQIPIAQVDHRGPLSASPASPARLRPTTLTRRIA
jgi:predicted RNA-binding Zn ribbon-like protein